jgi:hypothetical protein
MEAFTEPGAGFRAGKKQGRRRSMPPTALPAPDIEIGSRHPVKYRLPRESTGKCDPFHNRGKKVAANLSVRRFGAIQLAVPSAAI